jgi:two-component system, sensor histidine kinase and response regulator
MTVSKASADKILVVDDIPTNMWVLLEVLDNAGYEVLLAQSGNQALRVAEYAKPQLILLDVMMPIMDGFAVCQNLKSNPELSAIPIIFMTALSDNTNKIKGFELGAADYITKPIQYREVLARVATHLELYKLQQALQQRNAELEAFAHMVAHDLKNPLNSIINLTELIISEQHKYNDIETIKQKIISRLNWVLQASGQMREIIESLLLMAGLAQHKNLILAKVDMHQTLINVIEQRLLFMLEQAQAEIIYTQELPPALGYAPWIQEIWANYISNAIKYGGKPPKIHIGATPQTDGMLRFWIKDNGAGLSPENQSKLFTPFTRLHDGEGHGLGLSIVQQITHKLNGQVGVNSEIGQGCEFYFTLPADNTDKK